MTLLLRLFSAPFRHRQRIRKLRWREEPRWLLLIGSLFGGAYILAAPNLGAAAGAAVLSFGQAFLALVDKPVDKKSLSAGCDYPL